LKRVLKLICVVLSLAMLLAIPAHAAEAGNARASSYFSNSAVYLYELSGKTFEAWFEVTCVRIMDKVGAREIKIQRSTDNATWSNVATYSMDDYSHLICLDDAGHVGCVTYTGSSGYYYRAQYKLYAKDETGSATWTRTSASIYID